MKDAHALAIWINSFVRDYVVSFDEDSNEIQVMDLGRDEVIYWFDLDDLEL